MAFSTIREDGMVRCLDKSKKRNDSKLPDMGCYRQTTTYLLLAAELKKIELLTEFYINYHVTFRPDDYEKIIIEEMAETFYPIDHVHIGLHMIMYALSILGAANHPNCQKAWSDWIAKEIAKENIYLASLLMNPTLMQGKWGTLINGGTLYAMLSEKYRRD